MLRQRDAVGGAGCRGEGDVRPRESRWALRARHAGRLIGKIAKLPDQSAPAAPALHPSRTAIAFSLTGQPEAKRGFGSDIYMVDLDGTDLRAVLLHEDNNVFYASPRFDASGNVLYVHRRAAIIANGSFVGNEDTIERVSAPAASSCST